MSIVLGGFPWYNDSLEGGPWDCRIVALSKYEKGGNPSDVVHGVAGFLYWAAHAQFASQDTRDLDIGEDELTPFLTGQ